MAKGRPDKRVLVTGGSRGLGLAICRRLVEQGWHVVVASRSLSPALKVLLKEYPHRMEHFVVDFENDNAVKRLSKHARLLDGIAAYVANAGVAVEGVLTLSSEESLRRCMQINLVAPILLAREVIKGMLRQGGSLIFISSVAAKVALRGLAAYSATKGGLVAFSRAIAREFGDRNIRANCILPGFMETDMTLGLNAKQQDALVRRTPLGRLGQPRDVVGCVSFLLSHEARYITGAEFVVDGGFSV